MFHQIVEAGKTYDKWNNLFKYSCYACYQDLFSFFAKLNMLITTIGIIAIGTGMLGTIFGIEIVMIKKNFNCHWKDQGYHVYEFFISQC